MVDGVAAGQWRSALEAWRLPQALLDAAPEDPYRIPPGMLTTPSVDPRTSPTGQRILEVLDQDDRVTRSTLLDVGCGAGRFAGAFTADHRVVGVEPVDELRRAAADRGVEVVAGRWPEVTDRVAPASVACATHVLYDVADAAPFLAALLAKAQRRVVLELTAQHPWVRLGPLYRRLHDLDRPSGPSVEDAAALLAEVAGRAPRLERWERPGHLYDDLGGLVAHRRRQLCLSADRDGEIAAALESSCHRLADGRIQLPPYPVATLWLDR